MIVEQPRIHVLLAQRRLNRIQLHQKTPSIKHSSLDDGKQVRPQTTQAGRSQPDILS
jgi:hypothetical protein